MCGVLRREDRAAARRLPAPDGLLQKTDELQPCIVCRLEAEYRSTVAAMTAAKISLLMKALGKIGIPPMDRTRVVVSKEKPRGKFDDV
jgi:hypothetical protein